MDPGSDVKGHAGATVSGKAALALIAVGILLFPLLAAAIGRQNVPAGWTPNGFALAAVAGSLAWVAVGAVFCLAVAAVGRRSNRRWGGTAVKAYLLASLVAFFAAAALAGPWLKSIAGSLFGAALAWAVGMGVLITIVAKLQRRAPGASRT